MSYTISIRIASTISVSKRFEDASAVFRAPPGMASPVGSGARYR
jgi:hypothetical protein